MKFGLLYEWQLPAGSSPQDEARGLAEIVGHARLAEEVGFTSVWSVEHHFLEGFSYASAPEVLLSIRVAKRYEAMGVDILLCHMQFRGMPDRHVRDSIRLFGEEVIPAFA